MNILFLLVLVTIFITGCVPLPHNNILKDQNKAVDNSYEIPSPPPEEDTEQPAIAEKVTYDKTQQVDPLTHPKELIGSWRALSSRIFYDIGGGGALGSGTGRPLEINQDGSWQFGTSAGTWAIEEIKENDWKKWNINSYGPKKKIVLDKWNGDSADGPIEESDSKVDFFWVIYKTGPPTVSSKGQVQAKYGHAN